MVVASTVVSPAVVALMVVSPVVTPALVTPAPGERIKKVFLQQNVFHQYRTLGNALQPSSIYSNVGIDRFQWILL